MSSLYVVRQIAEHWVYDLVKYHYGIPNLDWNFIIQTFAVISNQQFFAQFFYFCLQVGDKWKSSLENNSFANKFRKMPSGIGNKHFCTRTVLLKSVGEIIADANSSICFLRYHHGGCECRIGYFFSPTCKSNGFWTLHYRYSDQTWTQLRSNGGDFVNR